MHSGVYNGVYIGAYNDTMSVNSTKKNGDPIQPSNIVLGSSVLPHTDIRLNDHNYRE